MFESETTVTQILEGEIVTKFGKIDNYYGNTFIGKSIFLQENLLKDCGITTYEGRYFKYFIGSTEEIYETDESSSQ